MSDVAKVHVPQLMGLFGALDINQLNRTLERMTEQLRGICTTIDNRVDTLEDRVLAVEAGSGALKSNITRVSVTGGSGGSAPVTEITPNTVSVALAGATTTAANVVPAESVLFGVAITVTGMTGATKFDAGIAGEDTQMFGVDLTASGWISNFTFLNLRYIYASAMSVILTPDAPFTGGTADVTGYYWQRP